MASSASHHLSVPVHSKLSQPKLPLPPTPSSIIPSKPTLPTPYTSTKENNIVQQRPQILGKFYSHSSSDNTTFRECDNQQPINESSIPTSTRECTFRNQPRLRHTSTDNGPTPTNQQILLGSAQTKTWPEMGLNIITQITSTQSPPINKSKFKFEVTRSAAEHNINLLRRFNFNLMEALKYDNDSFTATGSEFRSIQILEPLLQHHPLWNRLKTHLLTGIRFPLTPLSTQARHRDLQDTLKFGNHKGVSKFPTFYHNLNIEDIRHGF